MSITNFTDAELQKEIKRRDKLKNSIPTLIQNPDMSALTNQCKQYLRDVAAGTSHNDAAHYIYGNVMKTLFGAKVFDWLNKHL